MDWSVKTLVEELMLRLTSGPMRFRLIVQPSMALMLGIYDGLRDAKAGKPPLIWSIVFGIGDRRAHVKTLAIRLVRPIILASLADAIVQGLMFGHVRPLMALMVGTVLMALPYSAARGIFNRISSRRAQQRSDRGGVSVPEDLHSHGQK